MKREDYFEIMDFPSEQDITEMMQYSRSRQIPSRKEKITMSQMNLNEKKDINMTRNKSLAAMSVAAVLLALNIGGGFMLLHNKAQNDMHSPAGSMDEACTEQAPEEIPETVSEEITEQISEVVPEQNPDAGTAAYVQFMQHYYEDVSDTVCDYDFTGLGKDFDASWENDRYKITLRAVTGCDWILYYFYDVESKKGPTSVDFWLDAYLEGIVLNGDAPEDMPASGVLSPREDDGNIMHGYGVICNETGVPFFHDANAQADKQLIFTIRSGNESYELLKAPLDFVEQEYPLRACEQPGYISNYLENGFRTSSSVSEWMKARETSPLNQSAETPFGIFYLSSPFESDSNCSGYNLMFLGSADGDPNIETDIPEPDILSYTAYLQKNAAGETIRQLRFSRDVYCASFIPFGQTTCVSCLYALFDQPVDLSEGTLVPADGE